MIPPFSSQRLSMFLPAMACTPRRFDSPPLPTFRPPRCHYLWTPNRKVPRRRSCEYARRWTSSWKRRRKRPRTGTRVPVAAGDRGACCFDLWLSQIAHPSPFLLGCCMARALLVIARYFFFRVARPGPFGSLVRFILPVC